MKMKLSWMAMMASIGFAAMAGTAAAQVVSAKEFGSGSVSVAGKVSETLNYTTVRLNTNHTFVVQVFFKTESSVQGFSGRWSVAGPHDYALKVTSYNGRKATGTGDLRTTPDEQDFSRVSLSGSGAAGPFSLNFASSVAQGLSAHFKLRTVEHGTGTLNIGSNRYDVRTAWVDIVPEGNFALRLMGDKPFEVRGTWALEEGRNDRIHLTLKLDAGSNPVTGNGTIVLRSNRRAVVDIQIDGSKGGQSFAGHFNAINGGGAVMGGGPVGKVLHNLGAKRAYAEVDTTQLGSGNYMLGNDNANITEARVILMPNARAEVTVFGATQRTFTGTWKNMSNNEVQVNITGGYHHATGTGNVVLDSTRKKVTEVNLNGTLDGLAFSVFFNSSK